MSCNFGHSSVCAVTAISVSFLFAWAYEPQSLPSGNPAIEFVQTQQGVFATAGNADPKPKYQDNQLILKFRTRDASERALAGIQPLSRGRSIDTLFKKYAVRDVTPVFAALEPAATRSLRGRRLLQSYQSLKLANVYRVQTEATIDVMAAISEFQAQAEVEYAEPNYIYRSQSLTNDPFLTTRGSWGQPYQDLWGLHRISAPAAWDFSTGEGIVVAVIDTGCDINHPDLSENIWTNAGEIPNNGIDDDGNGFVDDVTGWDFAYHDLDIRDSYGHGTHVAGTIAAMGNNGLGIVGVAWGAKVMVVKGLRNEGLGNADDLANAIIYAAQNGARVINMSWGGLGFSQTIEDAIILATSLNVTLVVAAGNNSAEASSYFPANSRHVITVGSSDHNDLRSRFSNYSYSMDFVAPGGDNSDNSANRIYSNILSLRSAAATAVDPMFLVGPEYLRAEGTSMASPHVAGLAALILQRFPSATPEEVRQVIRRSTDDVPGTQTGPGWDSMTGYGRINALKAVQVNTLGSARIYEPMPEIVTSAEPVPLTVTATAPDFREYVLEYGDPNKWFTLVSSSVPAVKVKLPDWDTESLPDKRYTIRLRVLTQSGQEFEDRTLITLDRVAFSDSNLNRAYRAGETITLSGMAGGGGFTSYAIQFQDSSSTDWRSDGITLSNAGTHKVRDGVLGTWDTAHIDHASLFRVRLVVKRAGLKDIVKETRITVDPDLHPGWPQKIAPLYSGIGQLAYIQNLTAADIDMDGQAEIPVGYGYDIKVYRGDGTMAAGWPQRLDLLHPGAWTQRSPLVGDLNGDGYLEIISGNSAGDLLAWDYQGKMLPGFPKPHYGNALAVADMNADGKEEIVASISTAEPLCTILDNDGNDLPGWPVRWPGNSGSGLVAVGDLDGDGRNEIFACARNSQGLVLHVLDSVGKMRPGWPFLVPEDFPFVGGPSLSDIDGDGTLEILVGTQKGKVFLIHADGSVAPGWPLQIRSDVFVTGLSAGDVNGDGRAEVFVGGQGDYGYFDWLCLFGVDGVPLPGWPIQMGPPRLSFGVGSAAFVDIDGDGSREIVVGSGAPYWPGIPMSGREALMPFCLHAFRSGGQEAAGFPKPATDCDASLGNTPAVMDMDGDGLLEIAWVNMRGDLFVWDTSTADRIESTDWPMNQHDPGRSGAAQHPAHRTLAISALGAAAAETFGGTGPLQAGYATASVNSGSTPYGTAIFSVMQDDVVISEAAVPAAAPTTAAAVFVEYSAGVPGMPGRTDAGFLDINTGLAMVNCGSATAHVTYTLRDRSGAVVTTAHGSMGAGAQFARFLDQLKEVAPDFNLPGDFSTAIQFGILNVASDQSMSVLALRLTVNQRRETLLTSIPVADMTKPLARLPLHFPHFVDGGGYLTTLVLLNTSDQEETGRFDLYDDNGAPLAVHQPGHMSGSMFTYAILPRGASVFLTDGSSASARAGSMILTPDADTSSPIGSVIFSYTAGGVRVTESGVSAATPTNRARIYVDTTGGHDTAVAVAGTGITDSVIAVRAFRIDGVTAVGGFMRAIELSPHGHTAAFAGQLISGLPRHFTGVLELYSPRVPFVALTGRSVTNSRGDFLLTTFPVADLSRPAPAPLIFPQIANGSGYRTQFILLSADSASNTTLRYRNQAGSPLNIGK
jgi:subtilisin family serine protease